jgi:hypothetical protein
MTDYRIHLPDAAPTHAVADEIDVYNGHLMMYRKDGSTASAPTKLACVWAPGAWRGIASVDVELFGNAEVDERVAAVLDRLRKQVTDLRTNSEPNEKVIAYDNVVGIIDSYLETLDL